MDRAWVDFDFVVEVAVFGFVLVAGFWVEFADDGAVSANANEQAKARIPAMAHARFKYDAKRLTENPSAFDRETGPKGPLAANGAAEAAP